jgi:hypothetical protein
MSVPARGERITTVRFQTASVGFVLTMHKSSKIFSSRADEMTSFDSFKTFPEESIKSRRPDRILGFQETNSFSRRLENHNLMAGRLEKEPELETIWETIDSTILNHKGKALLFPFLIIEAKSRTGASFEDCNLQTALPILKMLKIQEDLQKKSQMTLEYGGPLVWYIAYRGEDWRLSGCYISEKLGGTSYVSATHWIIGWLYSLKSGDYHSLDWSVERRRERTTTPSHPGLHIRLGSRYIQAVLDISVGDACKQAL